METNPHYQLVAKSLHWVAEHRERQPELAELAAAMEVSPHHLQRTFQCWAGVSPKQFLKSLTRQAALERLAAGESVLEATYAAGLSGPGRLHDLMVSTEALTPGQIRRGGLNVNINFGYSPTPFGEALLSWTDRGISFLGFCTDKSSQKVFGELEAKWPLAEYTRDDRGAGLWADKLFTMKGPNNVPVWLRGSPFQLKVWEALLSIPQGAHVTYGCIARAIGKPGAAQAVGNAVGSNPVAWIIPCHRVIRQIGELGGYRWGAATKYAMIGMESSCINRPGSSATP